MGKTYRRDSNDKKFRESLKKHHAKYKCRCEYCTSRDREKQRIKHTNEQIRQIYV